MRAQHASALANLFLRKVSGFPQCTQTFSNSHQGSIYHIDIYIASTGLGWERVLRVERRGREKAISDLRFQIKNEERQHRASFPESPWRIGSKRCGAQTRKLRAVVVRRKRWTQDE